MKSQKYYFDKRIKTLKKGFLLDAKGNTVKLMENNVKLAIEYFKADLERLELKFGYDAVAQQRYYQTLNARLSYVQNILYWFNKWDLREITEDNIKEIYKGIEKGEILGLNGKPLAELTKKDHYSKALRNGFFDFIHKSELARKVIKRQFGERKAVRYFEIDTLRKLANALRYLDHKLMLWLMFDTGIEISAILELKKGDFALEKTENDTYYMLYVRDETAKKTRSTRNILVYHDETNQLLNEYLPTIQADEKLFKYETRNAYKIINETSRKHDLRLKYPSNEFIIPKDFRSSCATYFMKEDWNDSEIQARLGHVAGSSMIGKYKNLLGLDQKRILRKKQELDNQGIKEDNKRLLERNRVLEEKIKGMSKDLELIKKALTSNPKIIEELNKTF